MKKIVITGAAGFIGSNLVDRLIDKGYFIYGLDNLITGSLKNLSHLQYNNKLPEDDPLKRRPDISLAKTILNWKPVVSKEVGIKHLINYYKQNKWI